MAQGLELTTLFYNLGRGAGLTAFAFVSLLIFSGDTARFFDRYFGLDKIIRFQKKFSWVTAGVVISHPVFFMLASGSVLDFLVPNFAILPLAAGIMAFYVFIIILIASSIYKRISYLNWQYLHLLNYVLFFFGLYHGLRWGSDSGVIYLRIFYLVALIAVMTGLIYRAQYKIRQRSAPKFYVKKIIPETKDIFTLVLSSEKKLNFKAGQFCFLRINKDKLYARHPFTMSSAPAEPDLYFTIKDTGSFTAAARRLKPGEEVKIDGPFGTFTEKDSQDNLVFIAGGVGIAPFLSLIKDQLKRPQGRRILLLYGAKTWADLIGRNFLDSLTADWLNKIYVLSRGSAAPANFCELGRIDKEIIKKYVKNPGRSIFYICGPQGLKDCALKALRELGIKKQRIMIEDFFW